VDDVTGMWYRIGFVAGTARYTLSRWYERRLMALAWHLPARLVYWCAIRVGAHASTGGYGRVIASDLNFIEALKRWDSPEGGDTRRSWQLRRADWREHGRARRRSAASE
jgi:hypothetical protein